MKDRGGLDITVKEIAELAGVSPSTVSFVLNGRPGVGKQTRKRVAELLQANGFELKQPSDGGATPRGVVKFIRYCDSGDLVERNDDFITQVMEGADFALRQARYTMSVVNVGAEELENVLAGLKYENLAGAIFLGTEFAAERYELLTALKFPIVAVDNCFRSYPINAIDMDNIDGAQSAMEYLYAKGHRKIGYLKSTNKTGSLKERCRGVYSALQALHMEPEPVIYLSPRVNTAKMEMERYLDGRPALPTAFFADNDVIAAGAMRALLQKGVRIPEDVSLIGFDDSLIASVVTPALTTMRIHKREMGICAVRRLVDLMQNQDTFITKTSVGVDLVERETVAGPREGEFCWKK